MRVLLSLLLLSCLLVTQSAAQTDVRIILEIDVDVDEPDLYLDLNIDPQVDVLDDRPNPPVNDVIRRFDRSSFGSSAEFPSRVRFADGANRFLVFGTIKDAGNNNSVVRFVPVQLFDRTKLGRPDLIRLPLKTFEDVTDAFQASFPFDGPDPGALDANSVHPIILALKYIIEQKYVAGETEWARVGSFLEENAAFVRSGSEADIERVLRYLHLYDTLGDDNVFPSHYTRFLLALIKEDYDKVRVLPSSQQSLEDYIIQVLKRLFREEMRVTFKHTDIVLSEYRRRGQTKICMDVAREAFAGFTDDFVTDMQPRGARVKNAISMLITGAGCGSDYRQANEDGPVAVDPTAKYLVRREVTREFMQDFIRLVTKLDSKNLIDRTSPDRPKEVWNWFDAYERALDIAGI